jgi:polyribonucleotide nucleotidyltransferase
LTSRLIDRPMRPLFPESWRNETQMVAMVLSADSDNDPDVIAVTGASAAAYCSDLPFTTPIAGGARRHDRRQADRQPDRERSRKKVR